MNRRRSLILFALAGLGASPATAAGAGESAAAPPVLPRIDPCLGPRDQDEILVCGRRDSQDRFRIPASLRDVREAGARIAGTPAPSVEPNPFAPCGIFQGQRRCNPADAALFGYGEGRDPITFASKAISALSDSD